MITGKELDLTEPIIVWILELDGNRAEVAAMLRDTGKCFELAVPFRGNFDKYQRWFLSGETVFPDDKPLEPVELPNIIRALSNGRSYTLVGCRVSGSVIAGTGTGIVVPTYVVIGASETSFEKIHAMRSSVPGLVPWTGLSSLALSLPFNDDSSKKTEVIAELCNEIEVDKSVGLKLRPGYCVQESSKKNEITVRQMVSIETRLGELQDWTWHLFYHRSLANLLTISDWAPRAFADMEVLRDEDSYELAEKEVWHPVLSYMPRVDRSHFENPELQYLICFSDIREEGIRKWFELAEECQQGMALLSYMAREQEHLALETLNMLTGEPCLIALDGTSWRQRIRHQG